MFIVPLSLGLFLTALHRLPPYRSPTCPPPPPPPPFPPPPPPPPPTPATPLLGARGPSSRVRALCLCPPRHSAAPE